jgi:ADP-heptose:LPS heptosyltransferase
VERNLARELPRAAVHRILVLRPNHRLGNTVLLTPLIAELERVFPGAEIDILSSGPAAADVFSGFRSVRHVFVLPRFAIRHLITTIGMIANLRRTRYDLAIDASRNSNSSRLLLALVSSQHRIGIPDRTSAAWMPAMSSAPRHLGALPVFLVRQVLAPGHDVDESTFATVDIRLTPEERGVACRTLDILLDREGDARPRATLGVFANATGAKNYQEAWWFGLLAQVTAHCSDLAVIEFIAADGVSRLGNRFPTYYSSSPRNLAAAISNMTCFVSGDCGVMHLACASGVATIGLFSISDPLKYAPRGDFCRAVVTSTNGSEEVARVVAETLRAVLSRRIPAALETDPLRSLCA